MSTGMSSTCKLTDAKLYRMINQSSLVDVGAQRGEVETLSLPAFSRVLGEDIDIPSRVN